MKNINLQKLTRDVFLKLRCECQAPQTEFTKALRSVLLHDCGVKSVRYPSPGKQIVQSYLDDMEEQKYIKIYKNGIVVNKLDESCDSKVKGKA
jgi:hypothetical protein